MAPSPPPAPVDDRRSPKSAFRFRSGQRCLDLAATLGGRYRRPIERLATPDDLARWLVQAGLIQAEMVQAEMVQAEMVEPAAGPLGRLEAARVLREAIYRIARALIDGDRPAGADVAALNAAATAPPLVPVLAADGRRLHWTAPDPVDAALSSLAREAIELFGGPLAARMRECSGTGCSLLFVDTSHASDRRWCSMEGCGNREKVRRYRDRMRTPEPARPGSGDLS